jgi:peptide/nickel transport system substrate-binding protein
MLDKLKRKAATLALCAFAAAAAQGQTLSVGLANEVTSVDPHFWLGTPNMNVADHLYNRLIERNDQMRMMPGLALSWRTVDPLTWEFKLRPGVTFHDGSPFSAEDVAFTIERIPQVKDSPGPFTPLTRTIQRVEVVDPLTVRFKTAQPYPLLPNDLALVPIISKKAAQGASTADFNSGKAAIGTGPYKLQRFARGDRLELVRNENYWGKKPHFQQATLKILTNDATRVAALLSNDVQAIDGVPVADIQRLSAAPELSVGRRASVRFVFLHLDAARDRSPFITDRDGKPLSRNPLKDPRVRQALAKSIDRELIRSKVMEGASFPSAQLMLPGLPGHIEGLKPPAPDVEGAKKLLADAGFAEGFGITLHGTNNRYVQDQQILQALAQMFSRIGIATKVEAMPASVFFPRNTRQEFSMSLSGWAAETGELAGVLRPLVATRAADKGNGTVNASGYSNAKVDELIDKAMGTLDDAARESLLEQAATLALNEQAIIPLHNQLNVWAMRKPIRFGGRTDERTHAYDFIVQP